MLYRARSGAPCYCAGGEGGALEASGTSRFHLCPDAARAAAPPGEECRGLAQWKASSQLRLLRCADGAATLPYGDLVAEAEARCLDGVLLDGEVTLLQPEERALLIDDDKRDGLSQQLLTDMFTRMSMR
mmetsp:Transcript_57994/g.152757  ORF Transcript_57994/g.152757 Transcript_57994/m.152757 type:complete len:129 (+) Transcript_57994:70-456(+)